MRVPCRFWRIACALDHESPPPAGIFSVPECLAAQARPPKSGDGLMIAAYDPETQTGQVRWLGVAESGGGETLDVRWRATSAEIWVDTATGRRFWTSRPGFAFADRKNHDYGLRDLFLAAFPDLEPRPDAAAGAAIGSRQRGRATSVPAERLTPMEVTGEPTEGQRSGVVYVLRSAYGYKVGRTRNLPSRMRTFGVKLPFLYTIPLCAWFDDCVAAERHYHDLFSHKRINGEWFDLDESDLARIRARELAA